MKMFSFEAQSTFAFDVEAETEKEARAKAHRILTQATRSEKWRAPDVDGLSPRIQIPFGTGPDLNEVYDQKEKKVG